MKSFSILTGKIHIWTSLFDSLVLADQLRVPQLAKEALEVGRTVVQPAGLDTPLWGLAMGQGTRREVQPVRLSLAEAGFPLFTSPMVCTTGRVPGIPGELGYYGANETPRSRRWIFSLNLPLNFWREQLMLPPIWGVRPAVLRLTSTEKRKAMRSQVYKEIQANIGGVR